MTVNMCFAWVSHYGCCDVMGYVECVWSPIETSAKRIERTSVLCLVISSAKERPKNVGRSNKCATHDDGDVAECRVRCLFTYDQTTTTHDENALSINSCCPRTQPSTQLGLLYIKDTGSICQGWGHRNAVRSTAISKSVSSVWWPLALSSRSQGPLSQCESACAVFTSYTK